MGGRGASSSRAASTGTGIPEGKTMSHAEAGEERTVSAAELLEHGYYHHPGLSASKLSNAGTIVDRGLQPGDRKLGRNPIKIYVDSKSRLWVDDGRHRLAQAVTRGEAKIPVRFVYGGKNVVADGAVKISRTNMPVATER